LLTLLLLALRRPLKTQHNCTLFYAANQGKNAGADMAQRGRRSGIPDCEPFEGLVLTPQVVSTSNLALGPVLHCSGNDNLSINRKKTIK